MDLDLDLAVIGAGWFGLCAAKTYLQIHPNAKLAVFDPSNSVGGTWCKDRLYSGLKSNNLIGTYEYPDFPMDEATFGVKPGEHIPGEVIQNYLTKYAEKFGVLERVRFGSWVSKVERGPAGGWTLTVGLAGDKAGENSKRAAETTKVNTRKLIVATGLTSQPFLPTFPKESEFTPPLFHCVDFPKHLGSTKTARNVAVLGGTKSGWDMVYMYATQGVRVDWIIRGSGHGPCWMAPPYVTPLKARLEKLIFTRFLSWFSPCTWGEPAGIGYWVRRLLHGTSVGRWIVDSFWNTLANDVITLNGYDNDPETAKLKPWVGAFWIGAGLGILNYPTDPFELVRTGAVKVHVADIDSLDGNSVCLSTGDVLEVDALACATGWVQAPPINFGSKELEQEMGLPQSGEPNSKLLNQIDKSIFSDFPRLKDQPKQNSHYEPLLGSNVEVEQHRPFQLYRFMVPPTLLQDRNIGFAGMMMCIGTSMAAQAQALWLTAYFDGILQIPKDEDSAVWDAALHSRFGKWRCPGGFGAKYPDFAFDTIPYLDWLLRDLGLETKRRGAWLIDLVSSYWPKDYKGLVPEWMEANCQKPAVEGHPKAE